MKNSILPHDRNFLNHEVIYDFPGIGWKSFMLSGRYMVQEPDAAPLILLSLTDMTKRKKIEVALIQAEKLAIASRLAATITHEINNPLEAITNLLYLASTGDDAAAAKSYAAQALEEVGRVPHITQQTLKFYRQSTAPSSVQVSEILDSLLVLYHGKLLANNISVHRQYREGPPILCLAGDLRQIFANIIANAVDAMKSGGSLTMRVGASFDWRNQERPGIRTTIADIPSNILSSKNSSVLNSSSHRSNMPNSNSTCLSHALKSSSAWCRAPGSSTASKTGSQTTAPGNNVAATAVIAFLTTDTVDTLGRSMGSESTGFLSWWLVDIRVSSTRVIGLVSLTHGLGPGQITGMTPMTSMFLTSTTGTTCITAGIPELELPSAFRCSGFVGR